MVTIRGNVEKVDQIEMTLTITMTVGEWRQAAEDLPTKYPQWKLGEAVSKAVRELSSSTWARVNGQGGEA